MSHEYDNLIDEDNEIFEYQRVHQMAHTKGHKPKVSAQQVRTELSPVGETSDFPFTYNASRHERGWLLGSLGAFYEQHWFTDVTRMVRGGKEASVYLCIAHPNTSVDLLAAKVYRPRQMRNLKNDAIYREGRDNLDADGKVILDDRMNHAMQKRTGYGQKLLHTSWLAHEYKALDALYAAGADVPRPYASQANAILMDYIGGVEEDAPALISIDLGQREANRLFERVVHNIKLMLANNLIHGDLSAYNILYWNGEITLIDFPQVIRPNQNRSSFIICSRDVRRVCEYFSGQGVRCDAGRLATDLWRAHHHRVLPDVHPSMLDAENEADVAYWKLLQSDGQ